MPCGSFVLKDNDKAVVLIAGGVGLTPMVSMLEDLVARGSKKNIVFIQSTKEPDSHAMASHVDQLTGTGPNVTSHVFYSKRDSGSKPLTNTKVHYGKINPTSLANLVPQPASENEYYFCGPAIFLGGVRKMLQNMGVPTAQANYEYFGPTEQ